MERQRTLSQGVVAEGLAGALETKDGGAAAAGDPSAGSGGRGVGAPAAPLLPRAGASTC